MLVGPPFLCQTEGKKRKEEEDGRRGSKEGGRCPL